MTLAQQFRGDIQAETLQEEGKKTDALQKTPLAQQFRTAVMSDSVGRSLNAAQNTTPDQALQEVKLSEQTGIPLDMVARNKSEIETMVKQRELDPADITKNNPSLAKFLLNPQNAALSSNDLQALKRLEKEVSFGRRAADLPQQFGSELVRLPGSIASGFGSLFESATNIADRATGGRLTAMELWLNESLGLPATGPKIQPSTGLKLLAEPIKEFASDIAVPAERQNLATDISGAVGQLSAQVVQALTAPQTLVPTLLAQGADIQAEKIREAGTQGEAGSDTAIMMGAATTAVLEKYGIEKLLNRVPPQIKNKIMQKIADVAAAGGIEAVQELSENIAQNVITQQLVNPEQPIIDEGSFREMTAAGGAASIFRGILLAATHSKRKQSGQQEQANLDTAVNTADTTWLKQNSPDKLEEFIAGAKQTDSVYLPIEEVTTYFQSQNIDAEQALIAAGVDRQDILAAQATGGDVVIPLEKYLVSLSEHHKNGLRNFARTSPEATAPGEAVDESAERQRVDEAMRQISDEQISEGAIKNDVESQLIAAGQDVASAQKYATLVDKAFTTIATRANMDPNELYQRYRLQITRDSLQKPEASAITLSQYTPDEVEFFRSMGIPVEQKANEPRPELQAAENVVTVGGGIPEQSWAENTRITGTDSKPATVYRGSRTGTTTAEDFSTIGAATGHPSAGLGVWLSSDRGDAAKYGTVGEYQLDLRNPKIYSIEDFPGFDSIEESKALREQLQAQGHDGVVIDARNVGGPIQFVVFKPESVIQQKTFAQSGESNQLEKGEVFNVAERISDAIRETGAEVSINKSSTDFGNSAYIEISDVKNSKRYLRGSVRVSDHSTGERRFADHIHIITNKGAEEFISDAKNIISAWRSGDANKIVEAKLKSVYAQNEGVERGNIQIAPSGIKINLFEKANLSTFLHESGHLFLEVMGDVAASENAPQQIKDDYQKALDWFGVKSRDEIKTEHHEKWARGFEQYLGEGKAPTKELSSLFSSFRNWLISIYKTLKNLNVELSDEVRGVFDRMIATDAEIAIALQDAGEFKTQSESGMDDKQWQKYQELVSQAKSDLEGQLASRAYNEMKREKESWWKEKSAEVAAEVEAEANQMPVYQAWAFLSDNQQPDGQPYAGTLEHQKLDKEALLSMYDQAFLNKSLRYKGVYQPEGGLHPSVVASQFGYESASQMVDQLAAAPKKETFVKRETYRRMLEQYGDMRNDGSLPDAAVKAAHNDRRFKAMEVELEAIGRQIGRAPPKVSAIREVADRMIAEKTPREIQPYLYLKAERKAARQFAEFSAKGQKAQAYEAKQKQLLNGMLYDRAWKAQEEIESIVDYATKLAKKPKQEKLAKAGGSYRQQINDILHAYQFRKLPLKEVDRQENLRDWVNKMQEEGDITAVPDSVIARVEQNKSTNYQNVSLEELRGVRDSLKNIDHLSVLKNKLLKKGEARDKDEAKAEMLDRLKETHPTRKTLAASEFAKTKAEQLGAKLQGMADALWRPETIIESMDGGESGPWHDYLWEPANQARALQNQLREKVGEPLAKLAEKLTAKWQKSLSDEWQIAGRKMTRRDIISMALNTGNEGNLDKMMRGGYIQDGQQRSYTRQEIDSALSHLTENDWEIVQSIWDNVELLWPDIVAQQERLSGLPPEKVQSKPFITTTKDGKTITVRGGYFPVAYDPRFSGQGEIQAEDAAKAMLQGKYTRAATPKGHLKERTAFAAPVLLDYEAVLTRHLDDVITDLSHREFLKQAQWIIADREIKNVLQERIGETGYNSLRGFIGHTVGADRPLTDSATKPWHAIQDAIISNTAVYALGFRVVTAWGNAVVAPIQAAARVKPSYMVRGFNEFYGNLRESTDLIHGLSPFMKNRATDLDASYVELMKKLGGKTSIRKTIARSSMQVHRWADYLAVHGIWLGRYRQALDAGIGQSEAAALADKAIRQTQTAGAPKDLSGIERDPTFKMFRMFIGPMVIMNNRIRESVTKRGAVSTWPEALGTLMAAWFLPAIIFELAVGRGPDEDDEPSDWYKWMSTKIGMYPLQTIPIVRDIGAGIEAKILGEYRQVRAAPIAEAGNAAVNALAAASENIDAAIGGEEIEGEKLTKDTLRALGPIFGLPTNQLDITGSFIFDVMTGEYEPESPLDYRYLLIRKPKGE